MNLLKEFHFWLTLVIIATGEEARCSGVADARVGTALAGVRRHFSSTAVASAVLQEKAYNARLMKFYVSISIPHGNYRKLLFVCIYMPTTAITANALLNKPALLHSAVESGK